MKKEQVIVEKCAVWQKAVIISKIPKKSLRGIAKNLKPFVREEIDRLG